MKVKHLESLLQQVTPFEEPNYMLEQYKTSAHLAARMIKAADDLGDIEDKVVLDLGCGTGILAIASQILGSSFTFGVDIDEGALESARTNADEIGAEVELIRCNVADHTPFCPARRAAVAGAGAAGTAGAGTGEGGEGGEGGDGGGCSRRRRRRPRRLRRRGVRGNDLAEPFSRRSRSIQLS